MASFPNLPARPSPAPMPSRHAVRLLHHPENVDEVHRFVELFGAAMAKCTHRGRSDSPRRPGEMGQAARAPLSAVTLVLLGAHTWKRQDIDQCLADTLAQRGSEGRVGLLGVLLPSYHLLQHISDISRGLGRATTRSPSLIEVGHAAAPPLADRYYDRYTVPRRLAINVPDYARVHPWPTDAAQLRGWIHDAWRRSRSGPPPLRGGPVMQADAVESRWYP